LLSGNLGKLSRICLTLTGTVQLRLFVGRLDLDADAGVLNVGDFNTGRLVLLGDERNAREVELGGNEDLLGEIDEWGQDAIQFFASNASSSSDLNNPPGQWQKLRKS